MFGIENLIGLLSVIVCAGLVFIFSMPPRRKSRSALRPIPALQQLRRAIGLAVEQGKRVHVSLGKASIIDPSFAASLVSLNTLEHITQMSMVSDRPPVATSGEGALAILSQNTMRAAHRAGNALETYDPSRARLAGITPFSYIAGAMPVVSGDHVATNLLVGSFGPEAVLLCDAGDQKDVVSVAATDSLPAQAALFAAVQEPLIGEELFSVPAYLQGGAVQRASLRVQDVLRWVIISILIIVALLKLIASFLGIEIL